MADKYGKARPKTKVAGLRIFQFPLKVMRGKDKGKKLTPISGGELRNFFENGGYDVFEILKNDLTSKGVSEVLAFFERRPDIEKFLNKWEAYLDILKAEGVI